jgi:flagellar hook-basal body complex protein FliE
LTGEDKVKINPFNGYGNEFLKIEEGKKTDGKGFQDMLTGFISDTNNQQLSANKMAQDFADGKDIEMHEVMIAGEKAKTSIQLLMEIRNKTIDMYKELTRIQI